MLHVAVVGVNHIGRIHCATYKENPKVALVAVCDLDSSRAQKAAEDFQTKAYTDLAWLLQSEEVDLVSVATSGVEGGGHHFVPTMTALEAGKDVFVEKPLSNDLHEAVTMVQKANEQGVRLACDLNHRFSPIAFKAKELMEQEKLGTPLFTNMKLTIHNPTESSEWFHMRALHTHSIDVMRFFMGDVRRVQSFMIKAPGRNMWSTASINMEFESGAVGHLTGSYDMSMRHPIEYCEVAGTKGRFVIGNVYEDLSFYPHDKDEIIRVHNSIFGGMGRFNDTISLRINHYVDEIINHVSPNRISGNGMDALRAQEVIEAAIHSQNQGGSVVNVYE